jgi:hypothetical protein
MSPPAAKVKLALSEERATLAALRQRFEAAQSLEASRAEIAASLKL